ncbi:MAG TPA: GAF domain-containing protein [Candidatus Limnocylindrales bacterium]
MCDQAADADPAVSGPDWPSIRAWAEDLAGTVAIDQPSQHVAIFVHDAGADRLRLVAQVWGAGEDTGEVVVGKWTIPVHGSVTGRVYRTGSSALCADVSLDPEYRTFPGGRSRSSLTIPVEDDGVVLAVVNVEAPWIGAFSIRDHDALRAAATIAARSFPGPRR